MKLLSTTGNGPDIIEVIIKHQRTHQRFIVHLKDSNPILVALASPLLEGKPEFVGRMRKGPCSGRNCFRQKAVEISNIFREALDLPGLQILSNFQEGN